MTEAPKIKYIITAKFDDGLFDLDEDGNWRKIGPPDPPCRCLYCMTARGLRYSAPDPVSSSAIRP